MKPDELKQTENEYIVEYLNQGYDTSRAKHYAHQKALRLVISELKRSNLTEYNRLVQKVQEVEAEEARQSQERLEAQRLAEERTKGRYARAEQLRRALVSSTLPLPNLRDAKIVSFRSWDINVSGYLHGVAAGSNYWWREVNFADRVPSETNVNGFYSVCLDAHGIVLGKVGNFLQQPVCGLISSKGRVLEHNDGWFRSEVAEILCLWYVREHHDVYLDVPLLLKHYPTTPLRVCTPRQVAEVLFKLTLQLGTFVESFGMEGQW